MLRAMSSLTLPGCILLVALGSLSGCASSAPSSTVSGLVVDVDSSGPAEVTGFTLRAEDGTTFTFQLGALETGGGSFAAPHLGEHLSSGDPVQVTYRAENGRLVATRLEDAPRR